MRTSQRTGVSTFASRTSPSTDQSLQKSFHLSTPKEFQNIFSNASKKNKTPDTQTRQKKHSTNDTNGRHKNGCNPRQTSTPTYNSGLA